jgi:cytoskeletal protein RodZ
VASKDYFTLIGSVLLSVFPGFPLAVLIIILLLNLFLLVWQQLVKLTRVQQQAEPVDDLSLESGMKEQELTVKTEKSLERTTLVEEVSYSRVSSGTDMEEVTTPSQFDDSEV